eukprot:8708789-Alexandrium_andersonii.AAC.1
MRFRAKQQQAFVSGAILCNSFRNLDLVPREGVGQYLFFTVRGDSYIGEGVAFAVGEPGIVRREASLELYCVISPDLL